MKGGGIKAVMLGLEAWPRPRGQNIRPRPRPRPRGSWPRPRPRPRGSGLGLESRGRGQSRGQDKIQCNKYKAIDYNKQRYPILDQSYCKSWKFSHTAELAIGSRAAKIQMLVYLKCSSNFVLINK